MFTKLTAVSQQHTRIVNVIERLWPERWCFSSSSCSSSLSHSLFRLIIFCAPLTFGFLLLEAQPLQHVGHHSQTVVTTTEVKSDKVFSAQTSSQEYTNLSARNNDNDEKLHMEITPDSPEQTIMSHDDELPVLYQHLYRPNSSKGVETKSGSDLWRQYEAARNEAEQQQWLKVDQSQRPAIELQQQEQRRHQQQQQHLTVRRWEMQCRRQRSLVCCLFVLSRLMVFSIRKVDSTRDGRDRRWISH